MSVFPACIPSHVAVASDDPVMASAGELYTIAICRKHDSLLACVPDGQNVMGAVYRFFKRSAVEAPDEDDVQVISGVVLANDEDLGEVVYAMCALDRTWLRDVHGQQYVYAVKPLAA